MRSLTAPSFRSLHIFVCHASEDRAAAGKLCDELSAEGIHCWFDMRSLAPGTNWEKEIEINIRRSDAVLVCVSRVVPDKKTYIQTEIRLVLEAAAARSRAARFVFPVLLEPCDLPENLRRWQSVDVAAEEGRRSLLAALRELASGTLGVAGPADTSAERDWKPPHVRGPLRPIVQATRDYERWLGKLTPLVREDFQLKHEVMSASTFAFLRATFYRWMEAWPSECPELAKAPLVLCAGDVHIEAFGTWLDPEGRLGWGLTNFDESYPLPYTSDLVRLAASVFLAGRVIGFGQQYPLSRICEGILEAYHDTLARGGAPYVLGARHDWLYSLVHTKEHVPETFWKKLTSLPKARHVPMEVREALERSLPGDTMFEVVSRRSGVGSLGWPRYIAMAEWMGGPVASDARYIPFPSAAWAAGHQTNVQIFHNTVLETARHTPNLRSGVWKGLFVKRIAPDITRVDLNSVRKKDVARLVKACARDVANVHLGTPGAAARILPHLDGLPARWLEGAAKRMAKRNHLDFQAWRTSRREKRRGWVSVPNSPGGGDLPVRLPQVPGAASCRRSRGPT